MNTILEQFQDKINGTFSFFDGMIIKGHIRQFFSTSGKGYFLPEQNVLLKDFSAYANQVTADIVSHVENMAASEKRPLIYLTSSRTSKEQTALRVLKEQPVDEGLICVLSVVEYCQTPQPKKHDNGLLSLDTVNRSTPANVLDLDFVFRASISSFMAAFLAWIASTSASISVGG